MDNIPYTVEAREDTGLYNGKFGVWLFLASEFMLFGALFSSYILMRVGVPIWQKGSEILSVPLGAINTAILTFSSVTMILSWTALREKNFPKFKMWLGSTILCAVVFLCIKSYEYHTKFEHHLWPKVNNFMATYFTMTGLHALHIIGGVVVLLYMFFRGEKMWKVQPERFTNRIEVTGLYWHFVDLVWLVLFPTLYLS
jgi:cytochrome c oxidase subunit 3